MPRWLYLAFVTLVAIGYVDNAPAMADVIVLHPVKDNTLIEDPDGAASNGSGPSFFAGNVGNGTSRRAVLAFDVEPTIPAGSVVNSVELRLHVSSSPDPASFTMTLHRIETDWGEGASSATGGRGSASMPGDATWIHAFYPDLLWSAPGGDFDTTASAATAVGAEGSYTWSADGMISDVQGWLDSGGTNYGWLLKGVETSASTVRQFDSRESSDESFRPALVIDYTPGVTQTRATTWGRVKNNYRGRGNR